MSAGFLASIVVVSCGQGGGSGSPEAAESIEPTEATTPLSGKPSPAPEPIETVGGAETGLVITIPEGFREVDPVRESEMAPSLDNAEGLLYVGIARGAVEYDGAVMMVDRGSRGHLFLSLITAQCVAHDDDMLLGFDPEVVTSAADLAAVLEANLVERLGNADVDTTSVDGYEAARGESQTTFNVDAGELSIRYVKYTILADDEVCSVRFVTQDESQVQKFEDVIAKIDVL